jgi:hypothetical protein
MIESIGMLAQAVGALEPYVTWRHELGITDVTSVRAPISTCSPNTLLLSLSTQLLNMRSRSSVYVILLIGSAYASSWFGSNPEYDKWSQSELRSWLADHHIKVPSHFDQSQLHDLVTANWASPPPSPPSLVEQSRAYADAGRQWSYDKYSRAQDAFQDLKEHSFDSWDESKLRAFLLEHGVVAPSGPREQLVLLAKQKYRSYTDAASYYSSLASESATSAYSDSTDTLYDASKSASSIVAQATQDVGRAFDDSKDYVYSAWDDNRLRSWLEDHGVVEASKASTHTDLIKLANDYCRTAVEPVWKAWSDSYMVCTIYMLQAYGFS